MSRVELAPEVADDLERIFAQQHTVADATARVREIIGAIDVLETNPEIGRPTAGDLRELIIGRQSRGYVALYRYVPEIDTVFVRGQKEAGYTH